MNENKQPRYIKITGNNCPACKRLSAYLDSKDINYEEVDIDSDKAIELLSNIPALGLPILIDTEIEDNYIIGFCKQDIEEFLNK